MTSGTSNRRLLWSAAIGLWLIGCLVIALGAGIWWGRRLPTESAATAASPVAAVTSLPTESPPTTAPSPEPATATPTVVEGDEDNGQSAAGDSLHVSAEEKSETKGDTLAMPTPTATSVPEGIIVFLSSRDHSRISDTSSAIYLELYAMRPDGSQQTRLSDGTLSLYNYPPTDMVPYAVDGQIVLHDYMVFDLRTRAVVDELFDHQPGSAEGLNPSNFGFKPLWIYARWSPASELVVTGRDDRSLYYLPSKDGKGRRLTVAPEDEVGDFYPSWSFDGNQLLFSRRWHDANQDGLWVTHKDGSEMHRIVVPMDTNVGIEQSAWSPDGQTIVYQDLKENKAYEGNFAFDFWTYDVNSQQTRRLTSLTSERENVWDPTWSPDSRKIAFTIAPVGQGGSVGQIYTIDVAGGEPRQLTSAGYANIIPIWLPLDADEILAGGDTPLLPTPTPKPRPKPTPAKPTNCPASGAQITSPAPGTRFTKRNNFVVGTANIPRFHHWRIEYSTDPNGGWNYLLERDYPVDNDKLVMIDASTVPNGPYGLRLTVVDETGNYPQPCEMWFVNGY